MQPRKDYNPTNMGDLVSVVIPAYNRAHTIAEALSSVIAQTYADWEAVVVDDGSADDTAETVEGMIGREPRIHLVRHKANLGLPAARNTGIRAAKGKWVAFLDSDDRYYPDSLEARLDLADRTGVSVVHSDADVIRDGMDRPQRFGLPPLNGRVYKELLRRSGTVSPAMIATRTALEKAGGFDETMVSFEEWDIAIRLSRHCEFAFLDRPTFLYDCRGRDAMTRDVMKNAKGYVQVIRKHRWEIIKRVGPAAMAAHYRTAADWFFRAGSKPLARKLFMISVAWWPFRFWAIYGNGRPYFSLKP